MFLFRYQRKTEVEMIPIKMPPNIENKTKAVPTSGSRSIETTLKIPHPKNWNIQKSKFLFCSKKPTAQNGS